MRKLGKYVDSFLPQLQAKDRAKKRAYEVALMPRRKSDRAQVLERKQMEGLNQTSPPPLTKLVIKSFTIGSFERCGGE